MSRLEAEERKENDTGHGEEKCRKGGANVAANKASVRLKTSTGWTCHCGMARKRYQKSFGSPEVRLSRLEAEERKSKWKGEDAI